MDIKKNFQTAVKELLRETEEEHIEEKVAAQVDDIMSGGNEDDVIKSLADALPITEDLLYEDETPMYTTPVAEPASASVGTSFAGSYSASGYNESGYVPTITNYSDSFGKFSGDMQTSLICADTVITGNITTNGHINLAGSLNGDLDAKGDIKVSGQVAGNIKGDNIDLVSCVIKGNTFASNAVSINAESRIVGDVTANELVMDGKIKGNVTVENSVVFKSNATVLGNIIARSISVEGGAVLRGEMLIQNEQPTDTEFEKL